VAPTDRFEHALKDIIYGRSDVLAPASFAAVAAGPARNCVLDKRLQTIIIEATGANKFVRVYAARLFRISEANIGPNRFHWPKATTAKDGPKNWSDTAFTRPARRTWEEGVEPLRLCRRPFCLSDAAMGVPFSMAK
jgi:hypothetical protein